MTVLLIEPFYGGSHKQLLDTVLEGIDHQTSYVLITQTARKWHWRARTSSLYFSQVIPKDHHFEILFSSSVLNLAELLGMRPDLNNCKKIIYFHENQLVYPIQESKERDFQYGYNQITTCLAADKIVFNSEYNKTSFLENVQKHLNQQPDFKLKNISNQIYKKCSVMYFPIKFCPNNELGHPSNVSKVLHIVWPHRWEHDKNPELFFRVLYKLKKEHYNFQVSVIGETFLDVPKVFAEAKEILKENILHFGFLKTKQEYYQVLSEADIVVSTASHEFFGVAMIEATYHKCFPLAPNKLVYPEIYPKQCLYNTENQLYKMLRNWCKYTHLLATVKEDLFKSFDFKRFSGELLVPEYKKLLCI